jgi:hypothetical protein
MRDIHSVALLSAGVLWQLRNNLKDDWSYFVILGSTNGKFRN